MIYSVSTSTQTLSSSLPYNSSCCFLKALFTRIWEAVKSLFQTNPPSIKKENWTDRKRIKVYQKTMDAIHQGYYFNSKNLKVSLSDGNTLHSQSAFVPATKTTAHVQRRFETHFKVINQDCLEMARDFTALGEKVALINFASPIEPGGGFSEGTSGQEEHICYRTELSGFMENQIDRFTNDQGGCYFPLNTPSRSGGLIHTPNVQVFRASQKEGFRFLDHPFKIGVLTSPAPVRPPLKTTHSGIGFAKEETRDDMYILIRTQLQAAYTNGYNSLVLGAFGCGAFRNPPEAVARIYHELFSSEFSGVFNYVGFAILDDSERETHNPRGNIRPFQELFTLQH